MFQRLCLPSILFDSIGFNISSTQEKAIISAMTVEYPGLPVVLLEEQGILQQNIPARRLSEITSFYANLGKDCHKPDRRGRFYF